MPPIKINATEKRIIQEESYLLDHLYKVDFRFVHHGSTCKIVLQLQNKYVKNEAVEKAGAYIKSLKIGQRMSFKISFPMSVWYAFEGIFPALLELRYNSYIENKKSVNEKKMCVIKCKAFSCSSIHSLFDALQCAADKKDEEDSYECPAHNKTFNNLVKNTQPEFPEQLLQWSSSLKKAFFDHITYALEEIHYTVDDRLIFDTITNHIKCTKRNKNNLISSNYRGHWQEVCEKLEEEENSVNENCGLKEMLDEKIPIEKEQDILNVEDLKKQVKAWFLNKYTQEYYVGNNFISCRVLKQDFQNDTNVFYLTLDQFIDVFHHMETVHIYKYKGNGDWGTNAYVKKDFVPTYVQPVQTLQSFSSTSKYSEVAQNPYKAPPSENARKTYQNSAQPTTKASSFADKSYKNAVSSSFNNSSYTYIPNSPKMLVIRNGGSSANAQEFSDMQLLNFDPSSKSTNSENLKPIIIDGGNVACNHGKKDRSYSCRGIAIMVRFFHDLGHHKIHVVVSGTRYNFSGANNPPTRDENGVLRRLEEMGLLCQSPTSEVNSHQVCSYDDRYMVSIAQNNGGVIISNDRFDDLSADKHLNGKYVRIGFAFADDTILLHQDFSRDGRKSLSQLLAFSEREKEELKTQNQYTPNKKAPPSSQQVDPISIVYDYQDNDENKFDLQSMPHLRQSMQKMSLHEQNNSKPRSPSVKKKLNYPPGLQPSKNINKSVDLSQPPPLSTKQVSPGQSFPRLTKQTKSELALANLRHKAFVTLEKIFPNKWKEIEQVIDKFPNELENNQFLVNQMLDLEI